VIALSNSAQHTLLAGEQASSFAESLGHVLDQRHLHERVTSPYWTNRTNNQVKEKGHDTIGVIAMDSDGNTAAAVSSNGARFKIPGRVGDAAICGAGCFAENDVGGCAATGDGDLMVRFNFSYSVCNFMRTMNPTEACQLALRPLMKYFPDAQAALVAVNSNNEIGAACVNWDFRYSYQHTGMESPVVVQVKPFK
jgi:N4-(beta-N-acetylglucosaminyl)-L-asparaginase